MERATTFHWRGPGGRQKPLALDSLPMDRHSMDLQAPSTLFQQSHHPQLRHRETRTSTPTPPDRRPAHPRRTPSPRRLRQCHPTSSSGKSQYLGCPTSIQTSPSRHRLAGPQYHPHENSRVSASLDDSHTETMPTDPLAGSTSRPPDEQNPTASFPYSPPLSHIYHGFRVTIPLSHPTILPHHSAPPIRTHSHHYRSTSSC